MFWNRTAVYLITIICILVVLIVPACAPDAKPASTWEKMDSGTTDYLLSVWGNSGKTYLPSASMALSCIMTAEYGPGWRAERTYGCWASGAVHQQM